MEKVSVEVAEQESVENALYKDPTVSVKDRVADLISRMTLEEKAAQMMVFECGGGDVPAKKKLAFSSPLTGRTEAQAGNCYSTTIRRAVLYCTSATVKQLLR